VNPMNDQSNEFPADAADLVRDLKSLRTELDLLKRQHANIVQKLERTIRMRSELEKRCCEIEKKHADFVSLFVAGYQFQPSLDVREIIRGISEIMINFIGAEHFGIYLYHPEGSELLPIGGEPGEEDELKRVPIGENFLSQVVRSGELFVNIDARPSNGDGLPVAAVPLMVSKELVGVLTISKLLAHKSDLEPIDLELLELLRRHASTSLLALRLHDREWQQHVVD